MIRPFRPDDAEAVVAVWRDAGLLRPWNDPFLDIQRKAGLDDGLFLVADSGGAVEGTVMAGYDGHRGWIYYLAVVPDRRRSGVGSELMAEAERRLLERGCPKVNLQVRADNEASVGFYRALGYSPDAVVSLGKRLVSDA